LGLIQVYRALGGGWQIRCNGCQAPGPFLPACALPVDASAPEQGIRASFGPPALVPLADR
jgi:hypothetical protein